MQRATILSFVILMIGLAGCGASKPTPPADSASAQRAAYRDAERLRDTARLSQPDTRAERGIDVESYALHGRFDWQAMTLLASVTVRVKLVAPALKEIVLDSGVTVKGVTAEDGTSLRFRAEKKLLHVDIASLAPRAGTVLTIKIAYEAPANTTLSGEQSALVATLPRKGDPITARTVATLSEPLGAAEWMPCHNTPADRALFSAELTMPESERLISNGDLIAEEVVHGQRRMRYATRYGLPTYLMAFAVGDFESTTEYHGDVPVSLWRRRGLPVDARGMLAAIRRMMAHYESLLVPYPFEKYSLVLLPQYSGGIEHAGITFQGELGSTQAAMHGDLSLAAHELGHQWFGDLMTIASWDDLWIKEGMATLLAEESSRPYEDESKSGRLFGRSFEPHDGDAIYDPSLPPDEKYTSGPYARAAWFYTQVRALLGERAFWSILADTLNRHRFGVIGTDEFLEGFRAALGDAQLARLKKALAAKALPDLKVSRANGKLTAEIADPQGALLVPVEARWYGPDGTHTAVELSSEKAASLDASDGGLLVLDPRDVHPIEALAGKKKRFEKELLPLLVPGSQVARDVLVSLGAAPQLDVFEASAPWKLTAPEFDALYAGLASEDARYRALQVGCEIAARPDLNEKERLAWKRAVSARLIAPPYLGVRSRGVTRALSYCRLVAGDDVLLPRFRAVVSAPESVSEAELHYLASVSTAPKLAFDIGRALLERGGSVRSREIGIELLARHLKGEGKFERPAPPDEAAWKGLFRDTLTRYEAAEILTVTIATVAATKDKEALGPLATAVLAGRYPKLQKAEVCAASLIATDDAAGWKKFVASLGDLARLPASVRDVVNDPKKCKKDDDDEDP